MKKMTRSEINAHNHRAHMYHDLFEIIKVVSGLIAIFSLWFTVMSVEADSISIGWIISSAVSSVTCGVCAYLCEVSDSELIEVEITKEDL